MPYRTFSNTSRFCLLIIVHVISGMHKLSAQKKDTYFVSNTAVQYGYSLKVQAEIGAKKEWLKWRIGISAGAGAYLGDNLCYPSLHLDLNVYRGGIGSKWPGDINDRGIDLELNAAYTFTAGIQNRMKAAHYLRPPVRNYPLYYFNTFNLPPLQNPYNWSASWGGNLVFSASRKKDRFQQVGFLNIHADRFQLSYVNDGPPFFLPFGDRFDRFHTGGGFISFHGDNNWAFNLLEIGYNKFTGYNKNAYELSNKIGTGYIYYKDEKQQFYNKSRLYVTLANTSRHFGLSLNLYNYSNFDIQHKIHINSFYPLHMVPYKGHTAIGGIAFLNQTKIGLQ